MASFSYEIQSRRRPDGKYAADQNLNEENPEQQAFTPAAYFGSKSGSEYGPNGPRQDIPPIVVPLVVTRSDCRVSLVCKVPANEG